MSTAAKAGSERGRGGGAVGQGKNAAVKDLARARAPITAKHRAVTCNNGLSPCTQRGSVRKRGACC